MKGLIVDASAALKLVSAEPGSDEVRRHVRGAIERTEPILVPPLFWLEIVNSLATRHRYPPSAIVEAVYELERLGVRTADMGRPATLAVIDAIGRTGLTAYDAAYLVLAESSDAAVLTADVALALAAGDRAILVGDDHGLRESTAAYAMNRAWPDWPGAVAYLGELRRSLVDTPPSAKQTPGLS